MKIADYGKAITSYIESPTTAQKLKSKESANLLAEVDFSGMSLPALKIYYERETDLPAPKDSRQLIIELKRLMKGLDEDGVATFATGGRANLKAGTIPGGYTDDAYEYIREIDMDIAKAFKKYKAAGGKLDFDTYSSEAKRAMFEKDTPSFKAEGGRVHLQKDQKIL